MSTTQTPAETRTAYVDLSQYHAGQIVEHSASIEAEGHYYQDGRDIFGRPILRWTGDRYRATHRMWDRSEGPRESAEVSTESPWYDSRGEAEDWLTRERELVVSSVGPLR